MATTLEQLLADYPSRQSIEDALFERARGDIERSSLANEESLFGRGLGLSTIQGEIERQRSDALSTARRDAFLAAQQAQLAAAAQIAQQQQFGQSLAQRQSEASSANRFMQKRLDQADRGQMFQAGGALGGAALNLLGKSFAPEIGGGLRKLFGMQPAGAPGQPAGMQSGPQWMQKPPDITAPTIEAPVAPYSPASYDELPQFSADDYSVSPVSLPDYSFGGSDMFGSDDLFSSGGLDALYWDNPTMQNWGDYL